MKNKQEWNKANKQTKERNKSTQIKMHTHAHTCTKLINTKLKTTIYKQKNGEINNDQIKQWLIFKKFAKTPWNLFLVDHSLLGENVGIRDSWINYWWAYKIVYPLWKAILQFFKKLGIYLPQNPAILILSTYPKDSTYHYIVTHPCSEITNHLDSHQQKYI